MTHITTFRTYEWLRAVVEIGIAMLIASACTAFYFATQVVPAVIAEENVRARKREVAQLQEASKQCSWVEIDDRLICRRKK